MIRRDRNPVKRTRPLLPALVMVVTAVVAFAASGAVFVGTSQSTDVFGEDNTLIATVDFAPDSALLTLELLALVIAAIVFGAFLGMWLIALRRNEVVIDLDQIDPADAEELAEELIDRVNSYGEEVRRGFEAHVEQRSRRNPYSDLRNNYTREGERGGQPRDRQPEREPERPAQQPAETERAWYTPERPAPRPAVTPEPVRHVDPIPVAHVEPQPVSPAPSEAPAAAPEATTTAPAGT